MFDTKEFYGTIDLIGIKLVGFYEVNILSKQTKIRYSYRGITGIHRHFVPKNLEKALTSTYNKRRYIRIAWDKKRNRFTLVFNMKGDGVRPNFAGTFTANYNEDAPCITSVIPAPTTRRCYVSYQRFIDAAAGLWTSKENMNPFFLTEDAKCFLVSTRGYYKLRVNSDCANGVGMVQGHNVAFRLATMDALTADERYNENSIIFDKDVTALPPVTITHPFGMTNKWIIQDTEGMVDLTFTPVSTRQQFLSVVLLDTQYRFIFGNFEGALVTKDGVTVTLKDFPGIVKDLRCRL